jgi:CRP-like cAMP-binding protein
METFNTNEIAQFLNRLEPFRSLPSEFVPELASGLRVKRHAAKSFIFHEGEDAGEGYILAQGRVAMTKSSPNGKELIVELIPPGDPFGIVALVDTIPYPLTARAQVETLSFALSRSTSKTLSQRFPFYQQMLFGIIRNRMQTAHGLARAIAHDRVETRLASVLCSLLPKFSVSPESDVVKIIDISRQELADLTGMTLETASRITKAFEREGILDASAVGVLRILDPERLQQFVVV